jgi:hypothetical protein
MKESASERILPPPSAVCCLLSAVCYLLSAVCCLLSASFLSFLLFLGCSSAAAAGVKTTITFTQDSGDLPILRADTTKLTLHGLSTLSAGDSSSNTRFECPDPTVKDRVPVHPVHPVHPVQSSPVQSSQPPTHSPTHPPTQPASQPVSHALCFVFEANSSTNL